MSAKLKSITAQATTLTATIALAVGLSACSTVEKSGSSKVSKAPEPVAIAAAPPPTATDPMAADPLFAAPPPKAGTSGGATPAGTASAGEASQRVPLGQLSGKEGPASQRVPLGALSKQQTDAKPAQPAKTTSAPLLIAPKAGESAVAAAMNAPPPPGVAAPSPANTAPSASAPNFTAPQPESLKPGAAKPAPAPQAVASADAKPAAPKKKGLLDFLKGGGSGSAKKGGPGYVVPNTETAADKAQLKIPDKKSSPDFRAPARPQDEETVIISSTTFAPPRETAQEFVPASLSEAAQSDAAGASLIDRPMTASEKNVAQRFEVLKTLLDEGLVTPEEYSRHRAANIGAMLPFTRDPSSAGLERPSAGAEAIVARLQALRRALELHAISTQQHASERTMILAALLPARPDQLANPVQPPADVIQGAAMTSRLQTLKTRGLISADEFDAERKAIDQYLRTGSFKGSTTVADKGGGAKGGAAPAAAKDSKDAKGGKDAALAAGAAAPAASQSETAEVTGPVLHLASFRSREGADKAWQDALALNQSILGQYKQVVRKIDLGQGKGVFYRLMVGGFANLADAENICIRLKANNQFCRPSTSASGS